VLRLPGRPIAGASLARRLNLLLCMLLAALTACQALPAPPELFPSATPNRPTLSSLANQVESRANALADFVAAQEGAQLGEGSQVRTRLDSWVKLALGGGSLVHLGPNTILGLDRLKGSQEAPVVRTRFAGGQIYVSLANGTFEVVTPIGLVTLQSAHAEVHYLPGSSPDTNQDDTLYIRCLQGSCVFANVLRLSSMQQLIVTGGGVNITGPAALPASAVDEFLAISPESVRMVVALTAAAPTSTRVPPTFTATTTPTASRTLTPIPTATEPDTEVPPTATDTHTPVPTRRVVTQPARPLPTRTSPPPPPPTSAPPPQPTDAPPPPPPPPPPTDAPPPPPPPPTNTERPPDTVAPPPTNTPAPPSATPEPTKTVGAPQEPTETPLPTKTASPAP
jgi:hypothetical protein